MAEDIAVSMLTSPSVATLGDSFRGVRGFERKLNSPGVTIWLCVAFAVLRTRFVLLLFDLAYFSRAFAANPVVT